MKIRTRTKEASANRTEIWQSGFRNGYEECTYKGKQFSHAITDYIGAKNMDKPCSHVRTLAEVKKCFHAAVTSPEQASVFIRGYTSPIRFPSPEQRKLPELDWDSAMHQVYMDAWGMMPTSSTMAVNIAEAASLKSLLPDLFGWVKRLPKLKSTLQELVRKSPTGSLKTAAGKHLAVEFGLIPLFSDLKAMANTGALVRSKLDSIYRKQGEVYRVRAKTPRVTCEGSENLPFVATPDSSSAQESGRQWWSGDSYGVVSAKCHRRLKPELCAKSQMYIAALGITNMPVILYELMPFSFVLDYVTSLGDCIQRFTEDTKFFRDLNAAAEEVSLSEFVHSIMTVEKYGYEGLSTKATWWWKSWTPLDCGSASHFSQTYTRQLGMPPSGGQFFHNGVNVHRSAIGVSLLAQRLVKAK